MTWIIITLFALFIMMGFVGMNLRSLIRKWQHNADTGTRPDLAVGIAVGVVAEGLLIYFFIIRIMELF